MPTTARNMRRSSCAGRVIIDDQGWIAWLVVGTDHQSPKAITPSFIEIRTSAPDSRIGVIDNSEAFTCDNLRRYFLDDLIGIL